MQAVSNSWMMLLSGLQTVRKSESQFAQNKDKIIAAFAPQHKVSILKCPSTVEFPAWIGLCFHMASCTLPCANGQRFWIPRHLVLMLCNYQALNHGPRPCRRSRVPVTADMPLAVQEDGLAAMDRLTASFKKFDGLLEAKDKQGIPGAHKRTLQSTPALRD